MFALATEIVSCVGPTGEPASTLIDLKHALDGAGNRNDRTLLQAISLYPVLLAPERTTNS